MNEIESDPYWSPIYYFDKMEKGEAATFICTFSSQREITSIWRIEPFFIQSFERKCLNIDLF